MDHFNIIQALCRSALSNPSEAVLHQVNRLKQALDKDGKDKEVKIIDNLLKQVDKLVDMSPSKIQKSLIRFEGEELTHKTPLPVDKETSTPLAEIIFTDQLPTEPPIFDANIKVALNSIINEWLNFEKLKSIDAQPSRSCLIYGEPGTGKTHLALWIAKQMNTPVVLVRLDGLMSSFLGTTSRNIGNLFSFAAKYRCVLLLDEFDAIAKLRNDTQEVGEIKRVVNTLLQNLDSRKNTGFTIGITNHESLLDPAIWRRFEAQIEIPKPSFEVMYSILNKFLNTLSFNENELKFLSWCIEGASGADAESLSKWLKKSSVLNQQATLVDNVRRFAMLNSGRVNLKKRNILASSNDEDLINSLLNETTINFKQREIATLLNKNPSALSKHVSKSKRL
ncbi:ATP-binding protein [Arcicella aquatica]|uniref:ATP-binding protein n=1 Tax=Arcicella aquatica TaxID=217141 RepID=A0ABU5QRW3_9BACT|nr:ATP-binding protein [Arcicella aquatica]MEA5259479.1 ATP-binding protein [Arcicella aquatica]